MAQYPLEIRLEEDFSIPLNSSAPTRELLQGSTSVGQPPAEHMVWIPGGAFLMGSNDHYPEEAPAHSVTVNGFWMDQYAVTNADFGRFVEATGYVTLAERPANPADYPGAKPELLEPSAVVFRKAPRPGRPSQFPQLVDLRAGRRLASSARARKLAPRPVAASGGSRRLRGRSSVCKVDGQSAADRGRMGIRCAWRARRC